MGYTVLARKYRPQTFEELVGQGHVARTLANAITGGRVAHAFLFTGVRGVGKTTTARLLAKALNCENGPTPKPCNACFPCREITAGVDLDVQEIDGASNNSVDDVRRLQESIPFRPARDRYKIVILDEVHMLSTGAFNALLKTLEEPPSHLKFIFATTENHKVPITIRSRCQRYDFRLVPQSEMMVRLQEILSSEGIFADDAVLHVVAREAAGSMRDALTLLDQLIAYCGDRLDSNQVATVLGIADRQGLLDTTVAVLRGDPAQVLRTVASLAERGVDMLHFSRQVVSWLRDLVVLRVVGDDSALSDLSVDEQSAVRERLGEVSTLELQRAFAALSKLVDEVGRAGDRRVCLEMGLVRIASRPLLQSVEEVLQRVQQLEARLRGNAAPRPSSSPRFSPPATNRSPTPVSPTPVSPTPVSPTPVSPTPVSPTPVSPTPVSPTPVSPTPGSVIPSATATAESTVPAHVDRSTDAVNPGSAAAPSATMTTAPRVTPEQRATGTPATASADAPSNAWETIVGRLRDPATAAVLEQAAPLEVTAQRIVLAFPQQSFFARQASTPEAIAILQQAAAAVLGQTPQVLIADEELATRFAAQLETKGIAVGSLTVAARHAERQAQHRQAREQEALQHPRVLEALEVFPEGQHNLRVQVPTE